MHHAVLWQMPSYIRLHTHTKNSLNQEKQLSILRMYASQSTVAKALLYTFTYTYKKQSKSRKVARAHTWRHAQLQRGQSGPQVCMAYGWMSRVTHTNEAHMNESCHTHEGGTHEWVVSRLHAWHVTHVWHVTHEWVISPIWTSHTWMSRVMDTWVVLWGGYG